MSEYAQLLAEREPAGPLMTPEGEPEEIVVSPTHQEEIVVDEDAGKDKPGRETDGSMEFRRTALKGRPDKIEVYLDEGYWVPIGVWTFEHYPNLSGEELRLLLIAKGLPEADASWYGVQRALRLAAVRDLAS